MKETYVIFLLLILNSFFIQSNSLKCGDNEIENCKKCGEGEESDTCDICQAQYFLLLKNLICMSCNNQIYTQPGCKEECMSITDYCQECKEGYYLNNGKCIECSRDLPGCNSCRLSWSNKLICEKCSEEEERFDSNDSKCVKCNEKLSNCKKCHFVGNTVSTPQCDECLEGYYIDSSGRCQWCSYENINGGKCRICPPGTKPDECYCDEGFALVDNSCQECSNNCERCEINDCDNCPLCWNDDPTLSEVLMLDD